MASNVRVLESPSRAQVTLLAIPSLQHPDRQKQVKQAAKHTSHRLYLFAPTSKPGRIEINSLTEVYNAIATEAPCLDLVPLLPSAGWTIGSASALQDLEVLLSTSENSDLIDQMNKTRTDEGMALLPSLVMEQSKEADNDGVGSDELDPSSQDGRSTCSPGEEEESVEYGRCAVGGTFDHLHAGHRLLLSAAALTCSHTLYLGIAGDELLVNKKNADLLEPYETRKENAVRFVKLVRPALEIAPGPIGTDIPLAGTMKEMDALVISRETVAGAQSIQAYRHEHGFEPLVLVTVDLIGATSQDPNADKLSSSEIRARHSQSGVA